MKILLIGTNGQIGGELQRTLAGFGGLVSTDRHTLDVTDGRRIRDAIRSVQPALIVNAAAYTAVDKAEHEPEVAVAINAKAPEIMAEEAKKLNCTLIHYSTDYVFDGAKHSPYVESDTPNPLNVYGRSKLAGENAVTASGARHLIFRTSWIYSTRGSNFLLTVRRLLRERPELRIVNDQIGSPTWARDIAEGTAKALHILLKQNQQRREQMTGLYHLTASGQTSWHGFAAEIMAMSESSAHNIPAKLVPIATSEYPTPARRPLNSILSNEKFQKTFGFGLPHWKDSLKRVLSEP